MDPAIIAAVITAAATIAVALWQAQKKTKKKTKIDTKIKKQAAARNGADSVGREPKRSEGEANKQTHESLSRGERFGAVGHELEVSYRVNGDCSTERISSWSGFKVVNKGERVERIRQEHTISGPSGRGCFKDVPRFATVPKHRKTLGIDVKGDFNADSSNRLLYDITIDQGGLAYGEAPLDFSLVLGARDSVALTREQYNSYRNDPFPHEYLAVGVDYPVDKLRLMIES